MNYKSILRTIVLFGFVTMTACVRKDTSGVDIKKNYYKNGNIQSELSFKEAKEDGLSKLYYEEGGIKSLNYMKNNLRDGYTFSFYPNGKLQAVGKYIRGKEDGDFVWYKENGKIDYFNTYKNGISLSFMQFDTLGNIYNAMPFITVSSEKDTIKLGETYTVKAHVNFPLPNFDCNIYIKTASTEKEDIYHQIGKGIDASYFIAPKETGEYTYEIRMVQLKFFPNIKDSVSKEYEKSYMGKYWVI